MRTVLLYEAIPISARPDEQDALVQLGVVEDALSSLGHGCTRLAIDLDLGRARQELESRKPDLVFNLVESLGGTDRLAHLAPALVESLGIPCAGASCFAMAETTDKLRTKRRLFAAGLPTPAWLESSDGAVFGRESGTGSSPWIVKRIHEDASLDLDDDAVVANLAAARQRLQERGTSFFAEAYVEGREFNQGLLESAGVPECLPISEILFEDWPEDKPRIVGYAAKWDDDSFEATHTPRRVGLHEPDRELVACLAALSSRCWELFGLDGWARVDFRVDADGQAWILEVNPNPCLSPDAGFAAAAKLAGLSSRDVVGRIIERIVQPGSAASQRPAVGARAAS